jgi:hypothetical protein
MRDDVLVDPGDRIADSDAQRRGLNCIPSMTTPCVTGLRRIDATPALTLQASRASAVRNSRRFTDGLPADTERGLELLCVLEMGDKRGAYLDEQRLQVCVRRPRNQGLSSASSTCAW